MPDESEAAAGLGRATSSTPPAWSPRPSSTAVRRLSTTPTRRSSSPQRGPAGRAWSAAISFGDGVVASFWRLTPLQRGVAVVGSTVALTLVVLGLVFGGAMFKWLAGVARSWREVPGGWLVLFFFIFATAMPPMIGYSTGCTLAGFVYGWKLGWPLAASAATLGSLAAFIASRTVLSASVDRMVGKDHRFVALGQVLRHDGIWYLTAIRFCPLPFSLSNGFLATIPTISPLSFVVATALSSPKLFIHAFVGSRLAKLAEDGGEMSATDKLVNWLGMITGMTVGITAGIIIYRRTMRRAAELARASAAEEGRTGPYEDTDETMIDPDDLADVWPEDDISLWEGDEGHEGSEVEAGTNDHKASKNAKGL